MPNWWRVQRDDCTCTIAITDVDGDGTPARGCIDDDCLCVPCGHEALWEDRYAHGPCCDTCTDPLCVVCRMPMTECEQA